MKTIRNRIPKKNYFPGYLNYSKVNIKVLSKFYKRYIQPLTQKVNCIIILHVLKKLLKKKDFPDQKVGQLLHIGF